MLENLVASQADDSERLFRNRPPLSESLSGSASTITHFALVMLPMAKPARGFMHTTNVPSSNTAAWFAVEAMHIPDDVDG